MMGTERKSMVMTEDEKKMTAYHEAGHAIVALHEPASDPIHKATIIPRGRALGMVMRLPERDNYSYHRDKMYANLAVCDGRPRRRGSHLRLRQGVSSGASSDISYATGLARDMVTRWGMSDALGPAAICRGRRGSVPRLFGQPPEEHVERDRAGDRQGNPPHRRAGLRPRQGAARRSIASELETLAKALLEYETLSGDEIKTVLAGGSIDRGSSAKPGDPGGRARRSPRPSGRKPGHRRSGSRRRLTLRSTAVHGNTALSSPSIARESRCALHIADVVACRGAAAVAR